MTSTQLLKSLIVSPTSGQAPTATLIFAHGLGDTGLGWLDVAKMLSNRPALRHVRFVLPNAPVQPVTLNMGMSMSSWFDITTLEDMEEGEDENGLQKSAGEIKKLVQAEIDGTGNGLNGSRIAPERVVIGGFSQVRIRDSLRKVVGHPEFRGETRRYSSSSSSSSSSPSSSSSTLPLRLHISSLPPSLATALEKAASKVSSPIERGIVGVGVDILSVSRLEAVIQRANSVHHFGRRILCRCEQEQLDELVAREAIASQVVSWLAVRWTAKEAAYKALYPLHRMTWSQLRLDKHSHNETVSLKPLMDFSDEFRETSDADPAVLPRLHLSVSHDGDYVVSFVVAEQGGAISYLAGLTSTSTVGGIIGLSTWMPLHRKMGQLLKPEAKDIPVFHGHGNADQIVQFQFGKSTVDFLKENVGMGTFREEEGKAKGVRFEVYPRMSHSACPAEIEHVGQFLEKVVPAP